MQKEQLESDLRKSQNSLDVQLTKALYEQIGKFSSATIRKHYGSWSLAMQEVFGIAPKIKQSEINCFQCGQLTKNHKFCSQSCSASFNNSVENGRTTGRKSVGKTCQICKTWVPWNFRRCASCRPLVKTNNGEWKHIEKITKSDVLTNDTQRYRRIRSHARGIATKHGLLQKCFVCEYKNYVECAHIAPIASFPDHALLLEINVPSNLCGLCPNHHWEYDHNLLVLQ